MKKVIVTLFVFTGLLLSSCSSVKVLDSWKADHVDSMNDKNILVVARTTNKEARIAFENEITDQILAKGLKATPSYTVFPKLGSNEKLSDERKKEIRTNLENKGFNGVVLSVLKDYQENTRTVGNEGYYASVNYGYTDWPIYFGGGFYTYFYTPMAYSTEDIYVEKSDDTITSKLYVLETVVYNLDEVEGKQLVAVVRSAVENPSDSASTAASYAKAIVKRLDKK